MFKVFIYVIRHLVIIFIFILLDSSNLQTWLRILFLWIFRRIISNIDIHLLHHLLLIRLIIIIKVWSLLQIHLSRCSSSILLLFWLNYCLIWISRSKSRFLILLAYLTVVDVGHMWHVWCSSNVLLVLLLHEHQMSLLEQFVVLHILLIHIKIMIPVCVSCTCWKVHVLILKIDNVQMVILVDDLLATGTWSFIVSTFASLISAVASFFIFDFKAFFVGCFGKLLILSKLRLFADIFLLLLSKEA